MKTKQYLLTALCTLCCALFVATDAVAQRVKPTLPEPDTIRSGEWYYLWNEEAKLFMGKDWSYNSYGYSYYKSLNTSSTLKFRFEDKTNKYAIRQDNGNYYLNGYYDNLCLSTSYHGWSEEHFYVVEQSDGTYIIQCAYNYNPVKFIAPINGNDNARILTNVTDSTYIKWRLIPDSCALDVARMSLYLELEQVDSTFNVEPYDEILANSTSADELFATAKEVNTMMSTTNKYQQMSWSDYKIQFINNPYVPWEYKSENQNNQTAYRFRIPEQMYDNQPKTSLKAIVNVNADEAVLVYDAFTYNWHGVDYNVTNNNLTYDTYYDCIHKHNELNVYIDGELVRNVQRDQISNNCAGYYYPYDTPGRFCERLTKGVHTIEWEYLRNGYKYRNDRNYYECNNGYICNVGVKNTPTEISVSLLEPGSLGTEILAQVNSVLEVRKLKIKGEMNAEDWKTIDLITYLFSLDLSEAVITEIPDNQFENHPWLYRLKLPEGLTRIGNHAFYQSHVEDIDFPSTLTTIGKGAFQHSDIRNFQAAHTQLQSIGEYAFANCRYLKNVMLPTESMQNIDSHAFANDRHIENVSLPKDMTSLGLAAFYECQRMRTLKLPEHLDAMGTHVFLNLDSLRGKIVFPEGMTSVPDESFRYCEKIDTLSIPNCVTHIGKYAFDLCKSVKELDLPDSLLTIDIYGLATLSSLRSIELPRTLKSLGDNAFLYSGLDSVSIPENTAIGNLAFEGSPNLKYAELPTSYYNIANKNIFTNCKSLNRIKIKSPTLLRGNTGEFVSNKGNITLVVPDYLVSSYKLDSYWYTYKDVEGFGTSEVDTWTINNPVTLGATSRFQGSPNVIINRTNLTVNGETGMELNDLNMEVGTKKGEYNSNGRKYYYNLFSSSTQLLSSADISVNGKLTLDYYTNANQWAYIALPFDIRVGDIETDAQYAIRYYDGANRAANLSAKGNWKNYGADDIIPAGTGFVYQTSKDVWNTFVAYDNVNKNRAWAARDLSTPLDSNACASSEHRGWNLVGNPWMTHFNIHAVDFTAPITVYDQYYRKYQAYSIIDDNVALHPTQAFFVQCPDDIEHITFPARGRQLTNVVTDQNGARAVSPRRLVDVTLSMGDLKDQTRVVMNDRATLGYDYGSDAGKFFAEDEEVLQLYTTDAMGTCYAINERPTDDCTVALAYMAPTAGDYTLALPRNQAGRVVLKDLLLGTETNLAQTDYTFTTDAGTYADRFVLVFASIGAMGLQDLQAMPEVTVTDGGIQTGGQVQVYTSDGRLVAEGEGFLPLQKGFYVVRAQGESKKVVIK